MKSLLQIGTAWPGAPVTKKAIIATAQTEADAVIEAADTNLLALVVAAQRVGEYVNAFTARLRPAALKELEATGQKNYPVNGAKVESAETGVSYDYSADLLWQELNEKYLEAQAALKEREATLKTVKTPYPQVLESSGEAFTVRPPIKKSTTSLKITL